MGNSYADDLGALYHELLAHPAFLNGDQDKRAFQSLYFSLEKSVIDSDSFIAAATSLTMFFLDGHTNIEIPYTKNDLCLPFSCIWIDDCLVLNDAYEDIPTGAYIVAIEGVNIGDLVEKMANRIPHENIYLVKSRMIHYPYQNYHIFSEMNLRWLFGAADQYAVTFVVNGAQIIQKYDLKEYSGFIDFPPDDNFVSFDITADSAVLRLDACIYNDTYKQVLRELAETCIAHNIQSLTLDLSRNMGGSSAVIEEFIHYVDIPYYFRYEVVDYSTGAPVFVTKRKDRIENERKDILFPSKIYCRVSYETFSSARTFAVTLKDNGIATIVGLPTGGKPNSYGMPRKGVLPHSGVRYRVSRYAFLRPNETLDDELSLFPD